MPPLGCRLPVTPNFWSFLTTVDWLTPEAEAISRVLPSRAQASSNNLFSKRVTEKRGGASPGFEAWG
jgi:hypothetical protein